MYIIQLLLEKHEYHCMVEHHLWFQLFNYLVDRFMGDYIILCDRI